MGIAKNLTVAALIYVGYQLLTKKKYAGLRKELVKDYNELKPTIVDTLDDLSMYLTVPTDIGNEHNRIKIEKELEKIKRKINAIDATKAAERASDIATASLDAITDTISTVRKKVNKAK